MNKPYIAILVFPLALLCCKEHSSGTDASNGPSFTYRTSSCISSAYAKSLPGARAAAVSDSIFTYSFTQNLVLDFSATGNCCPDSNRFTVSQEVRGDTLLVTVVDTARNLCKCMCLYLIDVQWIDLPLNRYVVRCRLGNGQAFIDPSHLVTVVRKQ